MNNLKQTTKLSPEWLNLLESQIGSVRYGVIQIVIHDSRVVQIERTEKWRVDNKAETIAAPPGSTSTAIPEPSQLRTR